MIGGLAALGTALLWSLTSIQFTQASRRIGSMRTNRIRLVLAVAYLLLSHLLLRGELWPTQAEPFRVTSRPPRFAPWLRTARYDSSNLM